MPELPEVETTRLGLVSRVVGRRIRDVVVREPRLRWPVPRDFASRVRGSCVRDIRRRGKYLLFDLGDGHLLVHLGMSGNLTVVPGADDLRVLGLRLRGGIHAHASHRGRARAAHGMGVGDGS